MRILIRTSRWAIWARRLGSVAVPLVIISIVLHRMRLITSDLFLVAAIAAALVAALAVLVSLSRSPGSGKPGTTAGARRLPDCCLGCCV